MCAHKKQNSLVKTLADRLRRRIQSERLVDGDFFTTELQLVEEYQVSRSIVREAVSRLCAFGMLEGRKRKGLIVRRPDPVKLLSESLPSLAASQRDFDELSRLRYVIEIGAIELAVTCATDEQIEQLATLASQFESAVRNDVGNAQEGELELAFHGLILQMTGSPLIAGLQQVLSEFFAASKAEDAIQAERSDERVVWQHHEIVSAIRDRDVDRARSLMRAHFRVLLSPEVKETEDE